jgi:hypothetical protein
MDVKSPLTKDELAEILGITIKRDETCKLITFYAMLCAYTKTDQFNIIFSHESAAGKTYNALECAAYFPEEDTIVIAYSSPTAFWHDAGNYNRQTRTIEVDLHRKILIFLDQPHAALLERLRPLLSHDREFLEYRITDRTSRGGLRTKIVRIRGFPTVIFCAGKIGAKDQERTRAFLLSPETSQDKLQESIKLAGLRHGARPLFEETIAADPRRAWLQSRIRAIKKENIEEIIVTNCGQIYDEFLEKHPKLAPRHQRDFLRLLSLVKAHALLNPWDRERRNGFLYTNDEDYEVARELYEEVRKSNELNITPATFEVWKEVINPLLREKEEDVFKEGISKEEIMRRYYEKHGRHLSEWRLRREIIPELLQAGLLTDIADPNDRRKKLYLKS